MCQCKLIWSAFILEGEIGFGIVDLRLDHAKRKSPCSAQGAPNVAMIRGRDGTDPGIKSSSGRLRSERGGGGGALLITVTVNEESPVSKAQASNTSKT